MKTKQISILIVEDEVAVLEALRDKFVREGFKVFLAKNGKEGVKKALKERPDIVLLDIVMPVMDGVKALKKIRADKRGKNILVIMLTNLSNAEKTESARNEGVCDFLIKSDLTLDGLVKIVRKKLDK